MSSESSFIFQKNREKSYKSNNFISESHKILKASASAANRYSRIKLDWYNPFHKQTQPHIFPHVFSIKFLGISTVLTYVLGDRISLFLSIKKYQ